MPQCDTPLIERRIIFLHFKWKVQRFVKCRVMAQEQGITEIRTY
jgi:hypothetical protein